MFFSENDIKKLKTCPLCSEELHDPRVLDCGSTACNICITNSIKDGLKKEIELNTEQTIQAIHEANEKFIE